MNWQRVLFDLKKHYGPYTAISKACGRKPEWASKIARGEVSEPKWSDGEKLLELWRAHCALKGELPAGGLAA